MNTSNNSNFISESPYEKSIVVCKVCFEWYEFTKHYKSDELAQTPIDIKCDCCGEAIKFGNYYAVLPGSDVRNMDLHDGMIGVCVPCLEYANLEVMTHVQLEVGICAHCGKTRLLFEVSAEEYSEQFSFNPEDIELDQSDYELDVEYEELGHPEFDEQADAEETQDMIDLLESAKDDLKNCIDKLSMVAEVLGNQQMKVLIAQLVALLGNDYTLTEGKSIVDFIEELIHPPY